MLVQLYECCDVNGFYLVVETITPGGGAFHFLGLQLLSVAVTPAKGQCCFSPVGTNEQNYRPAWPIFSQCPPKATGTRTRLNFLPPSPARSCGKSYCVGPGRLAQDETCSSFIWSLAPRCLWVGHDRQGWMLPAEVPEHWRRSRPATGYRMGSQERK